MVACKKISTLPHIFVINGKKFQYVKKYKYLEIYLSHNGSILCGQEHLVERVVKVWFSIRNGLYSQKSN